MAQRTRPIAWALSRCALLVAAAWSLTATSAWAQLPTTYTYDVHGRLVTANTPGALATYTYDSAGNRTQIAETAVTAPVTGPVSLSVNVGSTNNPVPLNLSGGTPTIIQATVPSHGTATVSGLSITYTPTGGYVGWDSFQYDGTNTWSTSAWGTVTINVLANFTATLSSSMWNWQEYGGGTPTIDPNIVVTPNGGTGPYTYAWTYVSGDTVIAISSTTSNSVSWTRSPLPAINVTYTAIWQCIGSDSAGHHSTSQVTVKFEHDPKQIG